MNATTLGVRMTVKKEAAFHEAGHAVIAHLSRFHAIIGGINLENYGAGEIFVSLSKTKLAANGKATDASSQRDKEVATDLAVVLSAGLVAEHIAESKDSNLSANPQCAEPDHELMKQQLEGAGLSKKFDRHEEAARKLLEDNWDLVNELAEHLFENQSVDAVYLRDFIEAKTT
jgi:ATP-dependent Zn protease